jgi:Acetyltransferase (GNAT) domain
MIHPPARDGAPTARLTVECVRDPDLLVAADGPLAQIDWPSIDADPEIVVALANGRGGSFRPYGIVMRRDGEVVGGAMMRLDQTELPVGLGYRVAYSPRVNALIAQHGGIAGIDDEEAADTLVSSLRRFLDDRTADAALMPRIRVGSPLARRLEREPWLLRAHFEAREIHRIVNIPATPAEFFAARSANTRRNVKRVRVMLERRVQNAKVRLYSEPGELADMIAQLERVAAHTWQRKIGGGFATTPSELALYRTAMAKDVFRTWILFDADRPIAFLIGLVHGGGLTGRFMAYDPAYDEYRPGFYLFARLIEDLCADDRIGHYDFGVGDSQFKRSFADSHWFERDHILFSRRLRSARLNLTRSSVAVIRVSGKAAARHPLVGRARQRWRDVITRS